MARIRPASRFPRSVRVQGAASAIGRHESHDLIRSLRAGRIHAHGFGHYLIRLVALAALLLVPVSLAWAEGIYKWVDAHGVVNYSSEPPPQSEPARQLTRIDSTPAVSAHLTEEERAARIADLERQLQENQAARADRLRIALLEEQLETERARQQQLRQQAARDSAAAQHTQARTDCQESDTLADCDVTSYRYPIVVAPVRRPHRGRDDWQPQKPPVKPVVRGVARQYKPE